MKIGYKPGLLIELLGITREQLRYWRRELDPVPSRPLFNYQLLLGYAVLKALIVDRWLEPRRLKTVDLQDFFSWFEHHHSEAELKRTVITINKRTAVLRILSIEAYRQSVLASDLNVEAVYLNTIEEQLVARFKAQGV
jgi:hypothetical protein